MLLVSESPRALFLKREETPMADIDESLMGAEERMEKAVAALKDNFAGVRTGRANAMVLACPPR